MKYNVGDRFIFKSGSHEGVITSYAPGGYYIEWSDIGAGSANEILLSSGEYEYKPGENTIVDKILTKYYEV